MTRFHSTNMEAVTAFCETPIIQRIRYRVPFLIQKSFQLFFSSFVSSLVLTIFPGVAVRFLESADWHDKHHGIRPLFGYFWNLCVNGIFPGQKRVSTVPHSDKKNVVGVCALVIYLVPGECLDVKGFKV